MNEEYRAKDLMLVPFSATNYVVVWLIGPGSVRVNANAGDGFVGCLRGRLVFGPATEAECEKFISKAPDGVNQ